MSTDPTLQEVKRLLDGMCKTDSLTNSIVERGKKIEATLEQVQRDLIAVCANYGIDSKIPLDRTLYAYQSAHLIEDWGITQFVNPEDGWGFNVNLKPNLSRKYVNIIITEKMINDR